MPEVAHRSQSPAYRNGKGGQGPRHLLANNGKVTPPAPGLPCCPRLLIAIAHRSGADVRSVVTLCVLDTVKPQVAAVHRGQQAGGVAGGGALQHRGGRG